MIRHLKTVAAALAGLMIAAGPVAAQQIENELVLITPVARPPRFGAWMPVPL